MEHDDITFDLHTRLADSQSSVRGVGAQARECGGATGVFGRTGVIHTPHGDVRTPAFIPVGTKASVKMLTPDQLRTTGAQAVLSNAYHLYLQPGPEIVDEAGGVGRFENWGGPTFTDSGGFQVMSLGQRSKKVVSMALDAAAGGEGGGSTHGGVSARAERPGAQDEGSQSHNPLHVPEPPVTGHAMQATQAAQAAQAVASHPHKHRKSLVKVDEDGVDFRSIIDGSRHRFTPEISMRIQHQLGADIMFAFDELTTLEHSRAYQEASVQRTHRWAARCLAEHDRLTRERSGRPLQSLWGVVQGAQYEDLRRLAARGLVALSKDAQDSGRRGFGGFGIGGALEKQNLGRIVSWVCEELPERMPRHLLGISEPDDLFVAVAAGADTFDCVAPTRLGRRGGVYTLNGRVNLSSARFRRDFDAVDEQVGGYVSENYSRAYIHHLLKAKEFLAGTLCSLHNLHFMVWLVDSIRESIERGEFVEFREEFLGRYYGAGWRERIGL